jgi:tetratricopeptide (TPR) repeat protein
MILFLAAALAAAPPTTAAVAAEVECRSRTGVDASTCLATHYAGAGRHEEAAAEFEKVAQLSLAIASTQGSPQADRALAAAGNMWIAADQPGKAALALDKALAGSWLRAEHRGEALLDRARAAEAQDDLKTARAKVSEAAQTISADPFLWYFSAALAVREGNAPLARSSINRALSLAPEDPTILFEAGHVAHFAGDDPGARAYWTRAVAADPAGPSGKAAREALAMLAVPLTVQSTPVTPK